MRCGMRSGYRIRISRMIAGQVTEIFGHGPWHSDRNVSTALLTIGHIGELSWKESNPQALSAPATCHGYASCPNWVNSVIEGIATVWRNRLRSAVVEVRGRTAS